MGTPGDKFPIGKVVHGSALDPTPQQQQQQQQQPTIPSTEATETEPIAQSLTTTITITKEEQEEAILPTSDMTILQNVPSLGIFIEHDLEQQAICEHDKGLLLDPGPSLNLQSLEDLEKQLLLDTTTVTASSSSQSDSSSTNVPLLVSSYTITPVDYYQQPPESTTSSSTREYFPESSSSQAQPPPIPDLTIPSTAHSSSTSIIIPELSLPGPSGLQTPKTSKSVPALIKIAPKRNKKPPPSSQTPKKPHVCPVCEKNFQTSAKLTSHQLVHSGGTPFKCEHCKKSFSSKFKLVRHVLIHSDRKPFSCTVCERTFHRKDHLKNHIKVHSPSKKVYTCERSNCKKEYTSVMSYRKHLALHSAEEGGLECKICSKVFETKADILYHLKIHAGSRTVKNPNEKKFTCDYCDRKFFTRKDVRRHLVVHTGTRNFLCQFCPQRFGRKDHLVRHIKKSHSKKYSEIESTSTDTAPLYDIQDTSQSDQSYGDIVKTESKLDIPQLEVEGMLDYPIEKTEIKLEELPDVNLLYSRSFAELSPMLCSEPEGIQYLSHGSSDTGNLLPQAESELLTELDVIKSELEVVQGTTSGDPAGLIGTSMDDLSGQQLLPSDMMDSDLLRLISDDENNLPLPGFSQVFKQQEPPS